jgi:hypothetical protein
MAKKPTRKKAKNANAQISSIGDLLKRLQRDLSQGQLAWFRGHSDARWQLLPSLARNTKHLKAEIDLIVKFKQNSALLLSQLPQTEWQWITIMQHHGVPTRLLDWTENPLIALYFAVIAHPNKDGALWMLFPHRLNESSNIRPNYPKYIPSFDDDLLKTYTPTGLATETTSRLRPIAVIGPRNTTRMQAQLGVFTVAHRDPTPIEAIDGGAHVRKYVVPGKAKQTIVSELALLGIGRFQLFPELQSIGENLKGGL